ncbi:MAG: protein rep, partial [Fusobacteriaceae bacterium]
AVMELATYSAKSNDILYSKSVFDVFYNALKGKRLIVFNGLFKEVLKQYKNGELRDFEESDSVIYIAMEWYKYMAQKGYELFRIDDIQISDLQKLYIDEVEID